MNGVEFDFVAATACARQLAARFDEVIPADHGAAYLGPIVLAARRLADQEEATSLAARVVVRATRDALDRLLESRGPLMTAPPCAAAELRRLLLGCIPGQTDD